MSAKDTPEAIAEFEIMKAKIKAFIEPARTRPTSTTRRADTSFPARYARAIAYYRELETEKALKEIDALIAERPDDPYLYELKGQTLFETDRAEEAEAPLRKSVELKPDAPLLRMLLGQDLMAENDPAKVDDAIVTLNRSLVGRAGQPDALAVSVAGLRRQGRRGHGAAGDRRSRTSTSAR